ncbi:hypothetical protein KGM_211017 [Danaus plexippus plexippus]|uniref:WW domain-containing protein n=1 Tax=Danaus plexippus plexippus TaxID=278856 RepID=A0A212FBN3_DANPL|nr:hypothetical protein KGM_211017 [Danaus plexippus plexippus]
MSTSSVSEDLVSSAWIVCQSKSYPGLVYYFNTLTGESVWDLNEPESEKAQMRVNILRNQSEFHADDCPEPAHSPQNISSQDQKTKFKYKKSFQTNIYNKQVINNQFKKPFPVEQFPSYNGSNPIEFNIPITPTFIGERNAEGSIPVTSSSDQIPEPKPLLPLSSRFKNISNNQTQNQFKKKVFKRNFKQRLNKGPKNNSNHKFHNKRKNNDFRRVAPSKQTNYTNGFRKSKCKRKAVVRNNTSNSCGLLNEDDIWLEENLQTQGKKEILDLTLLKKYLQIENTDLWYIIVDSNALLNHTNFINIFINSDEMCRLLVPKIVYDNINSCMNSRIRTQAHRAAFLISKQVDADLAFIDNFNCKMTTDEKHSIIVCCTKLIQEDCHVLILSNDLEIKDLKDNKKLVFTISEIKNLLTKTESENVESYKPKPNKVDSLHIKIVIPNTNEADNNGVSQTNNIGEAEDQTEVEETVANQIDDNKMSSADTSANKDQAKQKKYRSLSNEIPGSKRQYMKFNRRRTKSSMTIVLDVGKDESEITSGDVDSENSTCKIVNAIKEDIISTNITKDIPQTNGNIETNGKEITKNNEISEENTEYHNVMFEITDQNMEGYLQMKSDEFVSRFMGIMGEVLHRILQEEPCFVSEAMPPPWTLYEATECIKRKFHYDSDVVDATIKLLNVLFQLGGLRGKITRDISPQKYMEMYSFGVYLIDSLQGILSNSEDLQIAAESLSKLLKDIQNPLLDNCNQNSPADLQDGDLNKSFINGTISNETDTRYWVSGDDNEIPNKESVSKEDSTSSMSSNQCDLRCSDEKASEDVKENSSLDSESCFFTSLELRKNSPYKDQYSLDNSETSIHIPQDNNSEVETEIVRKFIKFTEYEEKFKDKSKVTYDSWTHRNDEYKQVEYESVDDENHPEGHCSYNEEMYESSDTYYNDVSETESNNNDINLDMFVEKMESYVKETYSTVYKFCNHSYQKLILTPSYSEKCDINVLAEKTYALIENLCNAFTRILEREKGDSEHKIQEVFKDTELGNVSGQMNNIEHYRNLISYLLQSGNALKDTLKLILDASKI